MAPPLPRQWSLGFWACLLAALACLLESPGQGPLSLVTGTGTGSGAERIRSTGASTGTGTGTGAIAGIATATGASTGTGTVTDNDAGTLLGATGHASERDASQGPRLVTKPSTFGGDDVVAAEQQHPSLSEGGHIVEAEQRQSESQKPPFRVSEKIWPPFGPNPRVIAASFISFVGAALANAGGVGGGGLFVPMFNLFLGYDAKTSTALSKSMIMGGAIASVFFNVQLKHPTKEASLINYDVARLMQPMLLLGISTGVMFNVMFPPWLITSLLCILLILMTVKTLDKALATRRKELSAATAAAGAIAREVQPEDQPQAASSSDRAASVQSRSLTAPLLTLGSRRTPNEDAELPPYDYEGPGEASTHHQEEEEGNPRLRIQPGLGRSTSMMERLLIGTPREVPIQQLVDWKALSELVLVWVSYLIIQLVKTYTENCSPAYWLLTIVQIPVSVTATVAAAWRLNAAHHLRLSGEHRDGGYSEVEDDTQWELKQVCIYPLYALIAGVMGGLLGIGGGMVMGPVLLELNLTPQVTAATSTFIVVFSSSLSVVEFYLLGRIPLQVAIYFGALAMVAAFAGLSIVRAYVIRSGKASVIIFLLGSIVGVSGILLGTLGTLKIYHDYQAGVADFGFRNPCTNSFN